MVGAGGQSDLGAEIGGVDLQAQLALVLGQGAVHMVDVEDIGLAGLQPRLQDALPKLTGIDLAQHFIRLGRFQPEHPVFTDTFHEFVSDVDAVMQVEALAVEIARRLADFQELLDLGMGDVEIDRRRAAPQRALGNRQGQPVHHMDEGNDAAGQAAFHFLADGADLAPISADAAAVGGQGDILVPGADNAFQRVRDVVEETGDGQPPARAAIGQDGRGRHEPEAAHGVIEALGMVDIVGIGAGDAGEHVLEAFAVQQIAVLQGGLAERRQQAVAGTVQGQIGRLGPRRQRPGHGWARTLLCGFRRGGLGLFRYGTGHDDAAFDHAFGGRSPCLDQLAVGIEIAIDLAKCGHARSPRKIHLAGTEKAPAEPACTDSPGALLSPKCDTDLNDQTYVWW